MIGNVKLIEFILTSLFSIMILIFGYLITVKFAPKIEMELSHNREESLKNVFSIHIAIKNIGLLRLTNPKIELQIRKDPCANNINTHESLFPVGGVAILDESYTRWYNSGYNKLRISRIIWYLFNEEWDSIGKISLNKEMKMIQIYFQTLTLLVKQSFMNQQIILDLNFSSNLIEAAHLNVNFVLLQEIISSQIE